MGRQNENFDWTPSNDALASAVEDLREQVAELSEQVEELEDAMTNTDTEVRR